MLYTERADLPNPCGQGTIYSSKKIKEQDEILIECVEFSALSHDAGSKLRVDTTQLTVYCIAR